ncbi:hypothetical protein Tco_1532408, partial [Tanacetum coccineum]
NQFDTYYSSFELDVIKESHYGLPCFRRIVCEGLRAAPTLNLSKLRDSSLKRLKICCRKFSKFGVVIHDYHYMQDYCIFPPHIPAKPLSFVEVYHIKLNGCTSHATFFSYIAEAKILTLTNSSLEAGPDDSPGAVRYLLGL